MLGTLEATGHTVVADLEAGIGTLTRMADGSVDVVLAVAEPTPKSIEVARRAADLVREKSLGTLVVVANRVRNDNDLALVRGAFPDDEIVVVPDDQAVGEADRKGVAPLDLAPHAPAVRALAALSDRLVPTGA